MDRDIAESAEDRASLAFRGRVIRLAEIVRYGGVGLATAAIFLVIGSAPGLITSASQSTVTALAIVVSGVFNFLAHYWFTFRSARPILATGRRYAILLVMNAILGAGLVHVFGNAFGFTPLSANALCAVMLTSISYAAQRHLFV